LSIAQELYGLYPEKGPNHVRGVAKTTNPTHGARA
jgi:hypothetical protein